MTESLRLPHGTASCEQIEAVGDELANAVGDVVDLIRRLRHDGQVPRAVLDAVDATRGPLNRWRSVGSPAEVSGLVSGGASS